MQKEAMRTAKTLVFAGLVALALVSHPASAQPTTAAGTNSPSAPEIVNKGKVPIPSDLQSLVKKFEAERGAYLTQQKELLAKLQKATTPAERAAIRASLQENRDDFLADIKEFRQDLKQQITELKDKLNNAELDRLIEEVKREVAANHNHHGKT
jgi:hypothetical protein